MKLLQEAPTKIWNKNFICINICSLCLSISDFAINPLVAKYTTYLGANAYIVGLLAGMFFGVSLLMKPVSGPAATKIDKRKLLIFVFAVGGVANLGYAAFHTLAGFAVFRLLTGIQYSLVGGLMLTIASDSLPVEKMTSGIGIFGSGAAIGMAVAPSIGLGLLNLGTGLKGEGFGYTLVFLFTAAILFLAVIPGLILCPVHRSRDEIASTGVWYKNILTTHALPMTLVTLLIIIPFSLINTYIITLADELHMGNVSTYFYYVLAVAILLSRPFSGYLADRFGAGKTVLPALAVFAASFLIIGFAKTPAALLIGAAVASLGFGGAQPAIQTMCMKTEVPVKRAVASNTIYIGLDLGFFVGPFLGGIVYAVSDYSTMFKAGVIPVVLSAICFVIILPVYNRRIAQLQTGTR